MKMISIMAAGAFILFSGFVMKKKETPLYQTKWTLKKLYHNDSIREVNTRAYIQFDAEKKRAGGNGSCNRFGGAFAVSGDSIRISQLVSTKMFCQDLQATEDSFFRLLGTVTRYKIKENSLLLFREDKLLLEFSAS